MDTGRTQELQTGIITVDLVIVDRFDATLLYEKRAVHAGRVCDVNTRPVTGISVVGQFADRVQFRVLQQLSYPVGMPFHPKLMMELFLTMTQPTFKR